MQNLLLDVHRAIKDKPGNFRQVYLCGLVSGMGIQVALLKIGVEYFDGYLTRTLRDNLRPSVYAAIRDLPAEWEKAITSDLILGWNFIRSEFAGDYFVQMGVGALFVSRLASGLREVGYSEPEIQKIVGDVVGSLQEYLVGLI